MATIPIADAVELLMYPGLDFHDVEDLQDFLRYVVENSHSLQASLRADIAAGLDVSLRDINPDDLWDPDRVLSPAESEALLKDLPDARSRALEEKMERTFEMAVNPRYEPRRNESLYGAEQLEWLRGPNRDWAPVRIWGNIRNSERRVAKTEIVWNAKRDDSSWYQIAAKANLQKFTKGLRTGDWLTLAKNVLADNKGALAFLQSRRSSDIELMLFVKTRYWQAVQKLGGQVRTWEDVVSDLEELR
ncbi:hypothetical protein HK101_006107 [Irineochytrium annulatum]|nr:hypothetical protein HK101_006107 [Irineochytrium annulatum]